MDPYAIHMTPGTSIAAHISRLHASIIVHLQDPYLDFHHVSTYTRKRLWSLPTVPSWVEFRDRYHDFMVTRASGWDGLRFQAQDSWVTIITEVIRIEEFGTLVPKLCITSFPSFTHVCNLPYQLQHTHHLLYRTHHNHPSAQGLQNLAREYCWRMT